jgi:ATP-dependent DNA helicase DinG
VCYITSRVIAPRSSPPDDPAPASAAAPEVDLRAAVDGFFRPGGLMEQACRGTDFTFEVRPQQREMALAVTEALQQGRHLAVEAGTGVGKSFAYLVPLILAAKARKIQVVVSTYTIGLQEQLMYKDIPFLQQHLGVPFKAVLVKGRSNYLCLRRLARAERHGGELFKSSLEFELERLRAWSKTTKDGSLQELQQQPPHEVWNAVNVEHGNCMWHKCPEYNACFLMKARNEIRDADLLVVNHHLFFSDLALRAHGAAILPDAGLAVLDEAHQLENVASEHLGLRLSQYQFEHWLRRLYVPDNSKGLLAVLRKGDAAHVVNRIYEEVETLFGEVRKLAGLSREKTKQVFGAPLEVETVLPGLITQLTTHLRTIHDELEDIDLRSELNAARRRGAEIKDSLEAFLKQTLGDSVYWVESEGARRQTVFYSAPIEVAPLLEHSLFGQLGCVVMTSATLAVEGQTWTTSATGWAPPRRTPSASARRSTTNGR